VDRVGEVTRGEERRRDGQVIRIMLTVTALVR